MCKLRNMKKNNKGVALVVALVVAMVVMVFCLSLLLITYSLFASVNNDNADMQCRELSQSLSRQVEEEITGVMFDTYEAQSLAEANGECPYWFFLRYNVWQNSWPYYCEDEIRSGHSMDKARKYFNVEMGGACDEAKVTMYWTSSADAYAEGIEEADVILNVKTTVKIGDSTYSKTTRYSLSVNNDVYETDDGSVVSDNTSINPNGNSIKKKEQWRWSVDD